MNKTLCTFERPLSTPDRLTRGGGSGRPIAGAGSGGKRLGKKLGADPLPTSPPPGCVIRWRRSIFALPIVSKYVQLRKIRRGVDPREAEKDRSGCNQRKTKPLT